MVIKPLVFNAYKAVLNNLGDFGYIGPCHIFHKIAFIHHIAVDVVDRDIGTLFIQLERMQESVCIYEYKCR